MLMNIALFGAQGELGALLLKKFLQNGDFVYIYTDTPDALKIDSTANYEIQRGSVSDESAMERTIAKGDAVVVCPDFFAYGKRKDRSTPVADGLEHILNVMKKTGRSRIFLTCAACGGQVGQNAMLRFFNKIVKAFMLPRGGQGARSDFFERARLYDIRVYQSLSEKVGRRIFRLSG